MNVLEIRGLEKSFGDKSVLRGLDLSVPEHSIFGFVGRNGAGKTTVMKAILGLIAPDNGEIRLLGERVCAGDTFTCHHVGYLPDVPEFYSFMTAREYLTFCGEIRGMTKKVIAQKCDELLSLVGLVEEKHRIHGYSRGMKQRLGIASALLGEPELLLCDEPTSALDPIGRKEILDILLAAKEQTTILFSTHILSDVERIASDVALLHDGKIAMQGAIDTLKSIKSTEEFTVEMKDKEGRDALASAFTPVNEVGDMLIFKGDDAKMLEIHKFIGEKHLSLQRIERAERSLESIFWEVTKK